MGISQGKIGGCWKTLICGSRSNTGTHNAGTGTMGRRIFAEAEKLERGGLFYVECESLIFPVGAAVPIADKVKERFAEMAKVKLREGIAETHHTGSVLRFAP